MSAKYDQLIFDTAVKQGFTPMAAKFVVAQARYETSDYSSNVFKTNMNTSGMKYVGQPLATRGSLAPQSERSPSCKTGGNCTTSDYYAKYNSVADSAKDVIERLYEKNMGGVTPTQLKNAKTPTEFAELLKARRYYGQSVSEYASGLRAKLMRIQVVDFVTRNKTLLITGLGLILVAGTYYWYNKK